MSYTNPLEDISVQKYTLHLPTLKHTEKNTAEVYYSGLSFQSSH